MYDDGPSTEPEWDQLIPRQTAIFLPPPLPLSYRCVSSSTFSILLIPQQSVSSCFLKTSQTMHLRHGRDMDTVQYRCGMDMVQLRNGTPPPRCEDTEHLHPAEAVMCVCAACH